MSSRIIVAKSASLFGEAIRSRSEILREQSERIATLLDSAHDRREELDSLLGWRYRAGYSSPTDHLNRQALRSRREYAPLAPIGTLRVAAFGDSFVYGNEVADADAWCAVLESSSRGIEVLNYGVGGYGLDQALLRFTHEGMELHPEVVLIGFAPDDMRRVVNVYRRFISTAEWPLAKPRFVLRDGVLTLVPNPLPHRKDYRRLLQHPDEVRELGAFDQWYSSLVYEHPLYDAFATVRVGHAVWEKVSHRLVNDLRLFNNGVFNDRSSAFVLQVELLRSFSDSVRARHALPVIVLFPEYGSVESLRNGGPPVYAPLRDALIKRGVVVWDAGAAFRDDKDSVPQLFAPGGHYSPLGNRRLAEWLLKELEPLKHGGVEP